MANINLFSLGGQDENGKDLFIIEVENNIFVINIGIKFPVNDRWGIDGIVADTEYLQKNKSRIQGIFLTHAHDEVFAALPWLIIMMEGLTIYGSEYTIKVAKNRVAKYKINHKNYKFEVIKDKTFGDVKVKTFSMTTSIPGALAYNFKTLDGNILFMSETIIDDLGIFGKTDLKAIKEYTNNNILALLSDSRRANYPKPATESKSLKEYVEPIFKKTSQNKRIIFGAFDEQMFNIFEVIELANKYNRAVAFYGSAFSSFYDALDGIFKNYVEPNNLINYKKVNHLDNIVVLVTGTWSRLNDRFNRITALKDIYLKFRNDDAIIMYMPPVNGMEVEYSVVLDNIAMITPNITSIDDKMVFPLRQSKADIGTIIETLKPEYFLPISSLFRYQKEAAKMAISKGMNPRKIIILKNGKIAYFKNGALASQKGDIKPCRDVIIQGYGIGDVSIEVINERRKLASGGLVLIACQYQNNIKELTGNIRTDIIGVVAESEVEVYQDQVKKIVIDKFEKIEKFNHRDIQIAVRKKIQKLFLKKINKEPLVVTTFYNIN